MTNSFEIVVTILQTIEEYKKGNINRTTLELIIKGAINLVEENNRYDFSKNCGCGNERIGETWCCNQCGLPVLKQLPFAYNGWWLGDVAEHKTS